MLEKWDARGKSTVKWRAGTLHEGTCCSVWSFCLDFLAFFYFLLLYSLAVHFVIAYIKLSSVGGEKGGSRGWVGLCRRGLQFKLTSWNLIIVGTDNVDRSSPNFTLFSSDTMLKAPFSQISTNCSAARTWLRPKKPCKWG